MNERALRTIEFHVIKDMLSKHAQSSLGKEIINELMPVCDEQEVQSRLKETTEGQLAILRRGNPPLGGIYDVRTSLKKAEIGAILGLGELLQVSDILRASRSLKQYSNEAPQEQFLKVIDNLIAQLGTNKQLEDAINNAIISEEEISDNASDSLKNIRRQIRDTNSSVKDRLSKIVHSSSYQKFLQDSIVTIREGRYVVPVKQEYRNEIHGLVHDSSASGATLFIEPMAVVEANNKLKELQVKEKIEIERILTKLTEYVAENLDFLNINIETLAKLDFIFAKARFSLEIKAIEPRVNSQGKIRLIKARHPLIDESRVVPIDVYLGDGFNTLVITGPNTGGKTVTLKTVGLFAVMTQSGLHIPAKEESEISIFESIFVDIGDEQSIVQNLSTFSAHMTNISSIVKHADRDSLCLFDELGAGTDPTEGAALAMSILQFLQSIGAKTIATTHYSELKAFALTREGFENASCEFDVESLSPTYRILMGVPGKSNAFEISRRIGLDEVIIDSAKQFISKENVRFEDVIGSLKKDKETTEVERQKAEELRKEIEQMKQEIEVQKREIAKKQQEILLEAREKALEIVEGAKDESEEIISEVRQLSREREEREREKLIRQSKEKLKFAIDREENEISRFAVERGKSDAPPKSVRQGDKVYITNIEQYGEILTSPDEHGNLQVQVGIIKVTSNLKNLRLQKEEKIMVVKSESRNISSAKSATISSEINLRGQILEEAIMNVDKYLDDAYLSGLSIVTIVHGKGTGVLRSGIHQFLKGHPHVKAYRIGRYGEGETGVTIVEVK